jgi:hypothetical protein
MALLNISQGSVSNIYQDAKKNMSLIGRAYMLPFTHGTNIFPEVRFLKINLLSYFDLGQLADATG